MLSDFNPKILAKPEHYHLIDDYFYYLKIGAKHYAKAQIDTETKLKKIDLLERALRKNFPLKNSVIARLQNTFVKNNLSLYLLLDPVLAWRYSAMEKLPTSEEQLSEFVNLEISAFARLIMALYDENPSTYLPLTSLFSAFYLLEVFQNKAPFIKAIKWSKRQRVNKLKGLYKNSYVILQLVRSKRLKFRLAQSLNRAKILIEKHENNKQPEIGVVDSIRIFLYSVIQFIGVRHRTLDKNKM